MVTIPFRPTRVEVVSEVQVNEKERIDNAMLHDSVVTCKRYTWALSSGVNNLRLFLHSFF